MDSRHAAIPWVPPACTRSWRLFSNCVARRMERRYPIHATAWRKTSVALALTSSPTSYRPCRKFDYNNEALHFSVKCFLFTVKASWISFGTRLIRSPQDSWVEICMNCSAFQTQQIFQSKCSNSHWSPLENRNLMYSHKSHLVNRG